MQAANKGNKRVNINQLDIQDLTTIRDRSPIIAAAFDAVCSGLLVDHLEVKFGGKAPPLTVQRLIDTYYKPMLFKAAHYMISVGFAPTKIAKRPIDTRGDRDFEANFEGKSAKDTMVDVAIIPEPDSYRAWRELTPDGERVYGAEPASDDKKPVFVIASRIYLGFLLAGEVVSTPMGWLMSQFNDLLALERIALQVQLLNALPTVYAERVPKSAHAADDNTNSKMLAGVIYDQTQKDKTYPVVDETNARPSRLGNFKDMMAEVAKGSNVDPLDALITLPEHCRISTQPPAKNLLPDLEAARTRFERAVLAVFKVPAVFVTGANSGGISDKQSKVSSEHDVHRFRTAMDTLRADIEFFLKTVLEHIYEEDVTVTLPIMGLAKIDDMEKLLDNDVVDGQPFREHTARAAGFPVNQIVTGRALKRRGAKAEEPPGGAAPKKKKKKKAESS